MLFFYYFLNFSVSGLNYNAKNMTRSMTVIGLTVAATQNVYLIDSQRL